MTSDDLQSRLRDATEDDVAAAMKDAPFAQPKTETELLEFFNRMLDVMGVPDADGDVFEPGE